MHTLQNEYCLENKRKDSITSAIFVLFRNIPCPNLCILQSLVISREVSISTGSVALFIYMLLNCKLVWIFLQFKLKTVFGNIKHQLIMQKRSGQGL